jgi:CheY-like chemotaxis protein
MSTISQGARMPITILVVDDERSVRESLLRMLSARGYDAVGASSGSAALEKALSRRPDVVLMDLMMPVENGFETAHNMRSHAQLASVPIIALTASPGFPGETQSLFEAVLTKPCPSIDLLNAITKALHR